MGRLIEKNASTYKSIPYKLESMKGNIDAQIKDLEIKMECKDVLKNITELEENDAQTVCQDVMETMLKKIELRQTILISSRSKNSTKRLLIFEKNSKTWKERSVMKYFYLKY